MGLISRVSSRTYRFILTKIPYKNNNMIFVRGSETLNIEKPATEAELFEIISNQEQAHIEQLTLSVNGAPFAFESLQEGQTVQVAGKLFGGKVHGSLRVPVRSRARRQRSSQRRRKRRRPVALPDERSTTAAS